MKRAIDKSRYTLAIFPVIFAAVVPVWQVEAKNGWLDLVFGACAWLYWFALLAWACCVILAVRRFKSWWLLFTAPFVLFPVYMLGWLVTLLVAGNSL